MENFNKDVRPFRILVSPLDWGLGHTTRCIPLIHKWLNDGHEVSVACNDLQRSILESEFPQIHYYPLKGYNIHYGKKGFTTFWKLLSQIPKIFRNIKKEHLWLEQHLLTHPADYIISDNRYGFYSNQAKSIFITHQLAPISNLGNWADRILSSIICKWINRFSACWIPDFPEPHSLSGRLSKPSPSLHLPIQYIGAISRFTECKIETIKNPYILVILSGPEPQRTLFEHRLLKDVSNCPFPIILVRGTSTPRDFSSLHSNLECFDIADTEILQQLICNAQWVISRAGYTSVLDYARLRPKAILVPTPGQSEQQYSARYLQEKKFAPFLLQHNFSFKKALAIASNFPYQTFHLENPEIFDIKFE